MTAALPKKSKAPDGAPLAQLRKLAAQKRLLAGQARTLAAERRAVSAELKQLAIERRQLADQRAQLTQQAHQLAAQRRQLKDQARQLVDPAYVPVQSAPAAVKRKKARAKFEAAAATPLTGDQPEPPTEALQQPSPPPLPAAQPVAAAQFPLWANGQQAPVLDGDKLRMQFGNAFESINALFVQLRGFELQQRWLEEQRQQLHAESSSIGVAAPRRTS